MSAVATLAQMAVITAPTAPLIPRMGVLPLSRSNDDAGDVRGRVTPEGDPPSAVVRCALGQRTCETAGSMSLIVRPLVRTPSAVMLQPAPSRVTFAMICAVCGPEPDRS